MEFILIIGIIFSIFYGLGAVYILGGYETKTKAQKEMKDYTVAWWVHQIWINFVGSLIGWSAMYLILRDVFTNAPLVWQHIVLFLIGALGISGFLPHFLWRVSSLGSRENKFEGIIVFPTSSKEKKKKRNK